MIRIRRRLFPCSVRVPSYPVVNAMHVCVGKWSKRGWLTPWAVSCGCSRVYRESRARMNSHELLAATGNSFGAKVQRVVAARYSSFL